MVTLNVSKPVVQIVGNTSPASGEANTVSNLGAGAGIYAQKIGVDLQFKSLVAGSGVSITANTNDLTISSTASAWGGITGTLSNQTDLQAALNAKQTSDSTLTALAAYNTNGLITQTAADTFVGRSIVAGTNKITITNGNGVAGNPTVDVNEANFTGIPESAVTNLVSDLASKLSANQTITIAGDVTGSGATSITAIIPNDTVTFPKMQNIATGVILGRGSAGTGDIEQITVGAGLTLSGGTLTLAAAPAAVWGTITGTLSSQTDLQTALNAKLGTGLASTHIFVGSIGGVATDVAVSGDMSITNAGAVTVSGLQTKALPALATGLLKYNGTAWVFDSSAYLTANQTITLSGDATGSGATAIAVTLPNINSNVGTFNNVTVNAKGQVTAASNVSYLTANQTITLSGDVTGSGTTAITSTVANDAITFPKMQNIATNTLIGRSTAGNGDPEQITVGSGLTLSAGTISVTGGGSGWPFTGTGTFTGAVVIDETVTGANTLIFKADSLGVTPVNGKGLWLQNSTAATLGNQQISPSVVWEGQGNGSTTVNASQSVKYMADVLPVQRNTTSGALWRLRVSINAGAFADVMYVWPSGSVSAFRGTIVSTLGNIQSGGYGAVGSNYYYDEVSNTPKFNSNDYASVIEFASGGFQLRSSTNTGTAGNNISFSTYANLTVSSNLSLGGSSDTAKFSISQISTLSGTIPTIISQPGAHTGLTTSLIAHQFLGQPTTGWSWGSGTGLTQIFNYFQGTKLNTSGSATITNAYTVYIDPPVAGTITPTNNYAIGANGSIAVLDTTGANPLTISRASGTNSDATITNSGTGFIKFSPGGTNVLSMNSNGRFYALNGASGGLWIWNGAAGLVGITTSGSAMDFTVSSTYNYSFTGHKQFLITQTAQSGRSDVNVISTTPGAHTTIGATNEVIAYKFGGATWGWATGGITTQRFAYIGAFTATFASASTVTDAYSLYVDAPVAGTNATFIRTWGIYSNGWIGAPVFTRALGGNLTVGTLDANNVNFVTSNVGRMYVIAATGDVTIGSSATDYGQLGVLQPALTAANGKPVFMVTSGAHTNLTLSTEVHDVNINLNRTVQWSTGALTLQRAFRVQNPTYAFVGASTLTDAATVAIDGAPIAGTNATITNAHGLYISAASLSGGNTNGYGLTVNAPTGAFSLNAAAQFLGGTTFFAAATTSYASIILPHGTAPTSPVDGAMWTTSAGGLYVRINGVTVGPLGTGGGGGITNSAAANELMKSDGTNATPSGLFTATNGDITLGSTSIIGNRTIITSGSGNQSNLSILAMDSIVATQNGSSITLTPGAGNTSGAGGALNLNAGAGGITGVGGTITLLGGNGGATSGNGGDITITAGSAQGGNSNGGTLSLNGGAGNGSGVDGGIVLGTNSGVSIYGGNNGGVLFGNAGTNETRIKATNTNSTIKVHLKLEGTTASSGTVDGGDIILLGGSPSGAAAYGVINIATGLKKSTTTSSAGSLTLDRTSVIWVFTGSSATTWTLPDLASNVDLHYMIKNRGSANITLQSAGSDSIYDSSVVTSITITPSQAFIIQNDGTYWITM